MYIARPMVDPAAASDTVVLPLALGIDSAEEMDPSSIPPPEDTPSQSTTTAQTPTGRPGPALTPPTPELTSSTQPASLPGATNIPKPFPGSEPTPDGSRPELTTDELESAGEFGPSAQPDSAADLTLGSANVPGEASVPESTSYTEPEPSTPVPASTIQSTPVPPWTPPRSSLFTLPPDLPAMRARFFSLDTPLILSQGQFDEYWPFVDNMYVKNKERPVTLDNTRSAYYYCRLWKKSEYVGVSSAIRQRKKHCRATIACPMKFKAVFYGESTNLLLNMQKDSHVKIERLNDGVHNHDLDYVDSIKRNSAVRSIAAAEVSKGYKPCDVARNLRESSRADNLQALRAAGGAYMCLKDVHNAGRLKSGTPQSPS